MGTIVQHKEHQGLVCPGIRKGKAVLTLRCHYEALILMNCFLSTSKPPIKHRQNCSRCLLLLNRLGSLGEPLTRFLQPMVKGLNRFF
ncbi:hypothetical protein C7B76_27855 [filamentous cyanobacterium CCP2]|nr:hypothetical protein C7B76_27855 [filamentous cyanobacterium CCP2]